MSDRCATIIDEATGAVCGHRLGEHTMRMGASRKRSDAAFPCRGHQRNPDAPEGTDRRLPCPCGNFTPEADPT